MTSWQLESTGRYPQALKDHLAAWRHRPDGHEATQLELYLEAWDWLDRNGFVYHNVGHARCTGQYGFVDCSGGIALCRNAAGVNRETDASSFSYARLCHELPRPQWVTDHFGPGRGYQITPGQAKVTPASLKIVGRDEGQDYGDSHGHIESEAYPENVAVGAFSHARGVGYRSPFVTFDRPTYYAIQPFLGGYEELWTPPSPSFSLEPTMIIQTHHYAGDTADTAVPIPDKKKDGNWRGAYIAPAIDGSCVECHDGASLRGDRPPTSPPSVRRWLYPELGGAKVISVCRWVPHDNSVPGVFVRLSDGRGRPVRFS